MVHLYAHTRIKKKVNITKPDDALKWIAIYAEYLHRYLEIKVK